MTLLSGQSVDLTVPPIYRRARQNRPAQRMADASIITDVSVATIQGQLPAPVVFGDWIMKQREFAVVRLRSAAGREGWAFTLTRDGAVAEQIRKTIAPVYLGSRVEDRIRTFRTAWRRSLASHCASRSRSRRPSARTAVAGPFT